jgi:hypothetical protein
VKGPGHEPVIDILLNTQQEVLEELTSYSPFTANSVSDATDGPKLHYVPISKSLKQ